MSIVFVVLRVFLRWCKRTVKLPFSLPLQMIAVYDYEAQGDQELSLVEGDIVTLIAKEDEMWWCGQVRGHVGMFPSTYVEPYEDQGSIV